MVSKKQRCRFCQKRRMVSNPYRVCLECEPSWREHIERSAARTAALNAAYTELAGMSVERCMVCFSLPGRRRLRVHCDLQGRVLGLLCFRCEQALRLMRADVNLLRLAIGYLESGPIVDIVIPR